MLKTTESPDMSESKVENGNNKIVEFGIDGSGEELAKKSGKLKGQNLAKSQKLFKLGKSKGEKSKKLSKSGNLPNFDTTEAIPIFLTLGAKKAFNHLRLTFIEALIL